MTNSINIYDRQVHESKRVKFFNTSIPAALKSLLCRIANYNGI